MLLEMDAVVSGSGFFEKDPYLRRIFGLCALALGDDERRPHSLTHAPTQRVYPGGMTRQHGLVLFLLPLVHLVDTQQPCTASECSITIGGVYRADCLPNFKAPVSNFIDAVNAMNAGNGFGLNAGSTTPQHFYRLQWRAETYPKGKLDEGITKVKYDDDEGGGGRRRTGGRAVAAAYDDGGGGGGVCADVCMFCG